MLCLGKSEADVMPEGELGGCNPPGLDRACGRPGGRMRGPGRVALDTNR
jgi:hypothetical protein